MALPLIYPQINGVKYDFSSIELNLNGQSFVGFKSINYSRTRTRTKVYGSNSDPLAKTKGTNDYSGDCEVYLAEWNYFQQNILIPYALQQTGTGGYGDVFFTVTVSYRTNTSDLISDTLAGCTLDSTEASQSQGTDALIRKMMLNPLKIYFGGVEFDDLSVPLPTTNALDIIGGI